MNTTVDKFFDVPRTTVTTSEGDVDLPILYHDVSLYMAFMPISLEKANEKLKGTGFKAVPTLFNYTLGGLIFYEYFDTSVGVYNEVGVAISVVEEEKSMPMLPLAELLIPGNFRKLGFYVVDLPVTTARANAAGREIWGYPKFVTGIDVDFSGDRFWGRVADPKAQAQGKARNKDDIVQIRGDLNKGISLPAFDLVTLTNLNKQRIRTVVNVRGAMKFSLMPNINIEIGNSSHSMARNLRDLEFGQHSPMIAGVSQHDWQSRLNEGTVTH